MVEDSGINLYIIFISIDFVPSDKINLLKLFGCKYQCFINIESFLVIYNLIRIVYFCHGPKYYSM